MSNATIRNVEDYCRFLSELFPHEACQEGLEELIQDLFYSCLIFPGVPPSSGETEQKVEVLPE